LSLLEHSTAHCALGEVDHHTIAEPTCGIGRADGAMISGLRYGVTVRTLNSEIWTKSIKTSDATSMRARVRARHGVLQDLQMTRAPVANSNRVLRPPRRRDRPLCGAKTRAGGNCMVKVELGKARCRFH